MIYKVKSYILKFLITWNFFYLLWIATLIEVHVHVIFCLYEKLEKNINCVRTKTARAKLGVKTEALGLRKKISFFELIVHFDLQYHDMLEAEWEVAYIQYLEE